jgi:tetratricopeptide (TPR) repeat protein
MNDTRLRAILIVLILCIGATVAYGQAADTGLRQQAFSLYDQNKFVEAVPLLERLNTTNPNDPLVLERLAFSLMAGTAAIEDAAERTKARLRARTLALRARELGDNSNLLNVVLNSIPADGAEPPKFSQREEVDAFMREGEAAFARGDFAKALAAYERALSLDPQQYEAALFTGDVYFKQRRMDQAGEWFARAVDINRDRETAHRYWGDALMQQGKISEARDKFLEAIIAEPYNRNAWVGLNQWGQANRVPLSHPRLDVPPSPGASAVAPWRTYGATRAMWMNGSKFNEAFPNEKNYRHSLLEEAEALRLAAETLEGNLSEGTLTSPEPSLANLKDLNDAGLLEPYILLARPDAGIAQDYPAYRQAHRDKLREYLTRYVTAGK